MKKEALSALVASLLAGCQSADNATEVNHNQPDASLLTDSQPAGNATLKQFQLEKLLAELAEKPAPENMPATFAMCYEMACPAERFEYVCPECGEKTLYANGAAATVEEAQWYHEWVRDEVRELGLDFTIDERTLCASCKKTVGIADDNLEFYIEIRTDKKITRTMLMDGDWEKLIAFLKGDDTWKQPSGSIYLDVEEKDDDEEDDGRYGRYYEYSHPLKPEIPRIRALLGLDEKATEEKTAPVAKE